MRTAPNGTINLTENSNLDQVFDLWLQGSDIDAMVARVTEELARLAEENVAGALWKVPFLDLAGSGDGAEFNLRMVAVNEPLDGSMDVEGPFPEVLRITGVEGAQRDAFQQDAFFRLNELGAPLFALAGVDSVGLLQVATAGASQGTRFANYTLLLLVGGLPNITNLTLDAPAAGDLTIDGANLESDIPGAATIVEAKGPGVGAVRLTAAQIVAVAPGSVGPAQIIIDSTLLPGLAVGDQITVYANGREDLAVL